jgi:hypothetical protein
MKKCHWILFLLSASLLCSCATNNKRLPNPPKYLTVSVVSGAVRAHIQGEITVTQNFLSGGNLVTKDHTFSPRDDYGIIPRGARTIDTTVELSEGDTYDYALQSGETVILVFSCLTEKGELRVVSRGVAKRYPISATDKINLMLCFNN